MSIEHKYIVWVGGCDDYYNDYNDAKRDADEWRDKGYDDVIIQEIIKKPSGCFVHKKVKEKSNNTFIDINNTGGKW